MSLPSDDPPPTLTYADDIKTYCNLTAEDVVNGKRITWFDDIANGLFNSCARLQVSAHSLPEPQTLYSLLKDIDFVHADLEVTVGLAKKVLTWIRSHVNEVYLSPAMEETSNDPGARGAVYTVRWREYTLDWKSGFDLTKQGPTPTQGASMAWREPVKNSYKTLAICLNQLKSFLEHQGRAKTGQHENNVGGSVVEDSTKHSHQARIGNLQNEVNELKIKDQQTEADRTVAQQELAASATRCQELETKLHAAKQKETHLQRELQNLIDQVTKDRQADREAITMLEKSLEGAYAKMKNHHADRDMTARLERSLDMANAKIKELEDTTGQRSPFVTPESLSPRFPETLRPSYVADPYDNYRYGERPSHVHSKRQGSRGPGGYSYGADVYELPDIADAYDLTGKGRGGKVTRGLQPFTDARGSVETKEQSLRRLYGNRK